MLFAVCSSFSNAAKQQNRLVQDKTHMGMAPNSGVQMECGGEPWGSQDFWDWWLREVVREYRLAEFSLQLCLNWRSCLLVATQGPLEEWALDAVRKEGKGVQRAWWLWDSHPTTDTFLQGNTCVPGNGDYIPAFLRSYGAGVKKTGIGCEWEQESTRCNAEVLILYCGASREIVKVQTPSLLLWDTNAEDRQALGGSTVIMSGDYW